MASKARIRQSNKGPHEKWRGEIIEGLTWSRSSCDKAEVECKTFSQKFEMKSVGFGDCPG